MKILQKLKEFLQKLFGCGASHVRAEREKEYCIMPGCSNWTGNYKDTPIELRRNYRETQGDPCDQCAFELNQKTKEAGR